MIAAGDAGIYVAVMLFDGFALHLSPAPDNVVGHPFHSANNVNGISRRYTALRLGGPLSTGPEALSLAASDEGKLSP